MKNGINRLLIITLIGAAAYGLTYVASASAVNHENDTYTLTIKDEQTNRTITTKLSKYNDKAYELAYKVYIMNNKNKDAYLLARAAVNQRPNDMKWRRRLAEVAIWNGQYQIALDQWLYLANQTKNINDIDQGKKIATQIYNYDALATLLWLQISTNYEQKDLWLEYIKAVETSGKPQLAINNLQNVIKTNPDPFFKEQLATLYQSLGKIQNEKSVIDTIHQDSPVVAVQKAMILINQNRIKDAFNALHAARKNASLQDQNYWTMYAQMAWSINNRPAALYAYQVLLSYGNQDLESYQRIIDLLSDSNSNSQKALAYANKAMNLYKNNTDIPMDILSIQQRLGRWDEMGKVIDSLPAATIKKLNYTPYFWVLKAERYQYTSQEKRALLVYWQALKYLPDSNDLKRDFLWFIINTHDKDALEKYLTRIKSLISASPELWGAGAVGFYTLGKPIETQSIMSMYSKQLENNLQDPYWQLNLADIYDQTDPNMGTDFTHFGDLMRRYTWPVYLNLLQRQGTKPYYDQLLNYFKLSQQEASGDPTAIAVAMLMSQPMGPEAEELIVAWAIDQNNYDFAQAVYSNYLRVGIKPPATTILSLALHQEDRYTMKKLVTEHAAALQYRDRVDAANRINAIPLAQSLAMQGLSEHPNDYEMYQLFKEVMLETANHFDFRQEFYQYGSLEGPRTYLGATYFITPGISLTPYTEDWFLHVMNKENMATAPTPDETFGLKAKFKTLHGNTLLNVASRKSLETFPTALLSLEYLVTHDLTARVDLGYKQLANDTEFLYVGGYNNILSLQLDYALSSTDMITVELARKYFYTQDNYYLANGNVENIAYEHYFWQEYPDLSLRFYARAGQYYQQASQLTGQILKLIPPDEDGEVDTNVNQVIPDTNTEYGITAQVGMAYLEDYTHGWKPFSSATLLRNTVTHLGWIYNLGIAGSVFGRDHLAFYYEVGTNQSVGVQKEILIGMSYRYYF